MNNLFEIYTKMVKRFICNRETGKWVLADYLDQDVFDKISIAEEKKTIY